MTPSQPTNNSISDSEQQQERWLVLASQKEEDMDEFLELAKQRMPDKLFFIGVYSSQKQIAREFTEDTEDE